MKFKPICANLKEAISTVRSVVKGGDPLNPFSNVRIDSIGDAGVRVMATDGDVQVEANVYCDVEEQGAILVNGDRLNAFVGAIACGSVEFASGKRVTIDGKREHFTLSSFNPDEYPEMKRPGVDAVSLSIEAETLAELIRKSVYAASSEKDRAVLRGVCMEVCDGRVTFTATDGKRLATVEHDVEANGVAESSIIIPTAVAKLVRTLCGEGKVTIEADKQKLFVRGEKWCITSKLRDDVYPAWRRVFPGDADIPLVAEVMRDDFMHAVKTCALATEDFVKMKIENGSVEFTARSQISTAKTSTPCKYDGPKIERKIDPSLVLDALAATDEPNVSLCFGESCNALVFKCAIPYLALVMFVRKVGD